MSDSNQEETRSGAFALDGQKWVMRDEHSQQVLFEELEDLNEVREQEPNPSKQAIETAVAQILTHIGEDPEREGLKRTPHRVANMYDEILAGYSEDPAAIVNGALFDVDYDEMIVVKDIEYFSMCEHHMLPFFGRAHVAYIPGEKIIGLSKIPRIVEMFARRLQVQERMTRQIADLLEEVLAPQGVAVVVEGSHMCSMMRGVKKEHPRMVTSAMIGSFRKNAATRNEFMQLLRPSSDK